MEEKDRLNLVANQLHNILNGQRSVLYFRALGHHVQAGQRFWISTKNAHLSVFVLSFAKVFGSQRTEQLHWKRSVPEDRHSEFKKELWADIGITRSEFHKYVGKMLGTRNKLIAHRDLADDLDRLPDLSLAIKAMESLHGYLVRLLSEFKDNPVVYRGPSSLEVWAGNVNEDIERYLNAAVPATSEITEHH